MVVTGGDRPIRCEGVVGSGSRWGRGDGSRRDGVVGDDGFVTEGRGYNIAH